MVVSLMLVEGSYGIARLDPTEPTPDWAWGPGVVSVTRTPDEQSVLCRVARIPEAVTAERAWRLLRVAGTLDFSLTGIVHGLTGPLAAAGISVFVVSTYDTDYLAVRATTLDAATERLRRAGYTVEDLSTDAP